MVIKPQPLHPGDRVGIIAPSSPAPDPERLQRGIMALAERYDLVFARDAFERHGYLAGTDEVRLAELNSMLRREDLKAIFCIRGGYGVLRLLPYLDYETMADHPKLIIGYSDITALHMAFLSQSGVPGLAGPMVAPDWPDPEPVVEHLFREQVEGRGTGKLRTPEHTALEALQTGIVEGPLLGGNLTLLTRLLGTPYLPDLSGAILFIEEIGEAPYRIDGMLAQLQMAGILEQIGGLVLGGFTDCEPPPDRPSLPLDSVLAHYASFVNGPVASGLVFGHFRVKNTIPVGVRSRLEVSSGKSTLSILESVVATGV